MTLSHKSILVSLFVFVLLCSSVFAENHQPGESERCWAAIGEKSCSAPYRFFEYGFDESPLNKARITTSAAVKYFRCQLGIDPVTDYRQSLPPSEKSLKECEDNLYGSPESLTKSDLACVMDVLMTIDREARNGFAHPSPIARTRSNAVRFIEAHCKEVENRSSDD